MLKKIAYISLLISLISCNKDVEVEDGDNITVPTERIISLQHSYDMDIKEPSGLSFGEGGQFYSVDDNTNKIYKISKTGEVIYSLNFVGDDLEGITYNSISNRIYVVYEGERKIIELDTNGVVLNHWSLTVTGGSSNKGFEGISIDESNNIFYILNEASPGLLIKWDYEKKSEISRKELSFAKDYSGIFFDKNDNTLWIISDKSQKIFHTTTEGIVKEEFKLEYDKAEGIIVDSKNNTIYITRDFKSDIKLYEYKLSIKK